MCSAIPQAIREGMIRPSHDQAKPKILVIDRGTPASSSPCSLHFRIAAFLHNHLPSCLPVFASLLCRPPIRSVGNARYPIECASFDNETIECAAHALVARGRLCIKPCFTPSHLLRPSGLCIMTRCWIGDVHQALVKAANQVRFLKLSTAGPHAEQEGV